VIGNHEVVRPEGFDRFLALFRPPAARHESRAFSVSSVGGVALVSLDSNQLRREEQRAFADAALAASGRARARFVLMHDGPWSVGFHGDNVDAIREYVPIFARRGVDLVLSGHDHEYERGRRAGIDYVVTGGGGAPLYQPRCGPSRGPPCPAGTLFVASEYHYLRLEVHRDDYLLCPQRPDGTPLEPCVPYRLGGARR
jgi:3',5'-cyclic AMP phosphodiesterase CpdA